MTLTLLSFPAHFGMPSASPFCTKAMCLLEMSGLEWQVDAEADVRKSPKKKLPVLRDGGELIADSSHIQQHLETKYDCIFDAGLTDLERAQAHAIMRMAEEHLYFALQADRWLVDSHWEKLREAYFSDLPFGIRQIVPPLVRRDVARSSRGQGIARFSDVEVSARIQRDLDAIEGQLGAGPFLFGGDALGVDASVSAMLDALFCPHFSDGILPMLDVSESLGVYVERCRDAIFPSEDKIKWRES